LSGEVSCKIELCFHMHRKNLTALLLMFLLPGCAMTTILSLEWDLESIGNVTSLQLRSCKLLLCSFYWVLLLENCRGKKCTTGISSGWWCPLKTQQDPVKIPFLTGSLYATEIFFQNNNLIGLISESSTTVSTVWSA